MADPSLLGPVSGARGQTLFEVWIEVRCTTCPEQIAGVFATREIPHGDIEIAARRAGGVLVGGKWLCRACAERILERKRAAAQGRS